MTNEKCWIHEYIHAMPMQLWSKISNKYRGYFWRVRWGSDSSWTHQKGRDACKLTPRLLSVHLADLFLIVILAHNRHVKLCMKDGPRTGWWWWWWWWWRWCSRSRSIPHGEVLVRIFIHHIVRGSAFCDAFIRNPFPSGDQPIVRMSTTSVDRFSIQELACLQ